MQPFGTLEDVYAEGYEFLQHSMMPSEILNQVPTVRIGGTHCAQPYAASLLNISAMSIGSLSKNAVLALNGGARLGGFYHNTGEGGLSRQHLEPGGDIVWELGTGYFGACSRPGVFDPEQLGPELLLRRVTPTETRSYSEIFTYLQPGQLLDGQARDSWLGKAWQDASAKSFAVL